MFLKRASLAVKLIHSISFSTNQRMLSTLVNEFHLNFMTPDNQISCQASVLVKENIRVNFIIDLDY